jgi:hypothetical protein
MNNFFYDNSRTFETIIDFVLDLDLAPQLKDISTVPFWLPIVVHIALFVSNGMKTETNLSSLKSMFV